MLNVEYQILNVEYQILNIWNFELERFLCLHNDAPPPFVLKLSPLHLLPESPNIKQARKLQDAQAESWQIYKLQMTLLTLISMFTKMTIPDDTYPRYMIYDDICFMFYNMFMIWYDMIWCMIYDIWWYKLHDDDIYCWTCLIFMLIYDLWLQAQTPGVTHFRAYHRPPEGNFCQGKTDQRPLSNNPCLPPPLLSHKLWNV